MRNIRLTLAYDGTNYVGWQIQPNGPSVQAAVEQAVYKLTGEHVNVLAAGRTDSGVHALGQVANFLTRCAIPCSKIRSGLQHFLPGDIVVREAVEAADDFHATYSARQKRYRYIIHNSRVPDPFLQRYAWRFGPKLNAAAMHEAAQYLLGTHDFRCFESQFPNKATSVRTVRRAVVFRQGKWSLWNEAEDPCNQSRAVPPDRPRHDLDREFIVFEIAADGFLYNMVRAIVGTLVKVGRGTWKPEIVKQIIHSGDRAAAGQTAPARGLYLVDVEY